MSKQILNARGFHVVGPLFAVLFVAVVGFAGFKVFHLKSDSKAEGEPKPAATAVIKTSGPNIPAGWQLYTDKTLGAQFLYPNPFGAFSDRPDLLGSFPDYESLLTSEAPKDSGIPGTDGDFVLITYKKGHDIITTQEYGPKIKLTDNGWVVAEPNPYNPKNLRAGDPYTDMQTENKHGLPVYWVMAADQGAVSYDLYFMTNDRLHELKLPTFNSGAYTSDNIIEQGPYDAMFAAVRDSIALF